MNKLEYRLTRVANAFDCYYHLLKDLTQIQPTSKWQNYINNYSKLITKKGT